MEDKGHYYIQLGGCATNNKSTLRLKCNLKHFLDCKEVLTEMRWASRGINHLHTCQQSKE